MLIRTEKQLEALGERLARRVKRYRLTALRTQALVFALAGELGAGKTTFVRGFARGLGIRSHITSPTFVLARRHRIPREKNSKHEARNSKQNQNTNFLNSKHVWDFDIRISNFRYLWHLDLYRLHGRRELSSIHFQETLNDKKNIVLIEWADRVKQAIPKEAVRIHFRHHPKGRTVIVRRNK